MASTRKTSASQEISPTFDKLLKDVIANLSPEELKHAVSSIKTNFVGKFTTTNDQDLYSCLYLLANQGVFSEDNLTLLEKFVVTPNTSKKATIEAKIHNFKAARPLQESRKEELTGRNRDLTNVISMLKRIDQAYLTCMDPVVSERLGSPQKHFHSGVGLNSKLT